MLMILKFRLLVSVFSLNSNIYNHLIISNCISNRISICHLFKTDLLSDGCTCNLLLSKLPASQEITSLFFSSSGPKPVRYFQNTSRTHLLSITSSAATLVLATIGSHPDCGSDPLPGFWGFYPCPVRLFSTAAKAVLLKQVRCSKLLSDFPSPQRSSQTAHNGPSGHPDPATLMPVALPTHCSHTGSSHTPGVLAAPGPCTLVSPAQNTLLPYSYLVNILIVLQPSL